MTLPRDGLCTARVLTLVVLGVATASVAVYGPIAQPANYHDFADQRVRWGVPHALDVLSNVGFAVVACWALLRLWPHRREPTLAESWPGYATFFVALGATAVGSAVYHLSPDNSRLVWDRLPIVLASGGLLAAVYAETIGRRSRVVLLALSIAAGISVWWWRVTDLKGVGDLRPYLLLQGLPLVLVPLWQTWTRRPVAERRAFGGAVLLYVAAKLAELGDHQIQAWTTVISGHTLKHLLATAAAVWIATDLLRRCDDAQSLATRVATPTVPDRRLTSA